MVDEKALEQVISDRLRLARADSAVLASVQIVNATTDAHSLFDLVGDCPFEIFQDTSEWNTHPGLMQDIIGGMTPDIVVRSTTSSENRIIIEVKKDHRLGYGKADSQIVRYFLHLLATSNERTVISKPEIRRAVLLAAPSQWFEKPLNAKTWDHFTTTYQAVASHFGITLGAIWLPL